MSGYIIHTQQNISCIFSANRKSIYIANNLATHTHTHTHTHTQQKFKNIESLFPVYFHCSKQWLLHRHNVALGLFWKD